MILMLPRHPLWQLGWRQASTLPWWRIPDNVGSECDLGGMPCQVIRPVTSLADATGGLPSEQQQSQSVQNSLTTVVDW